MKLLCFILLAILLFALVTALGVGGLPPISIIIRCNHPLTLTWGYNV